LITTALIGAAGVALAAIFGATQRGRMKSRRHPVRWAQKLVGG
jgi:hypothetical protein